MIRSSNIIIKLMLLLIMICYYQCNGFISLSSSSSSSMLINKRIVNSNMNFYSTSISSSTTTETPTSESQSQSPLPSESTIDLTGYTAYIRFSGFDVKNMTALLSFDEGYQCSYSGGIDQSEPGFWRVLTSESGVSTLESTHQVLPEYM